MVNQNVTLILGAGASKPYGFPTGGELLNDICKILGKPSSKLHQHLINCNFNSEMIQHFRNELFSSMQPSVDFFLESRKEYTKIGKAAIAGCLIQYENPNSISRGRDQHWLKYFFEKMRTPEATEFSNNHVAIITFNYDRSIEYFFITALQNSYGLDEFKASDILKKIPIIHIYGKLGGFPNIDMENIRYFNSNITPELITTAASQLKIMSDTIDNNDELLQAQEFIIDSNKVCFLGFGFHKTNIDLLFEKVKVDLKDNWKFRKFFGSAFDIREGERNGIKNMFGGKLELGNVEESILMYLRNNNIFE